MARKLQAIEGEGRGWIGDTLANLVSGLGVIGRDKNVQTTWTYVPIDRAAVEAAYRSDWIARKIVDIPPFDMTREWRNWQAEAEQIEALEMEEKRLGLQRKVKQALRKARLYGGAVLVLGTGEESTAEALDPETVQQGGLHYVHCASRYEITAGEIEYDVRSPWYGEPKYYHAMNRDMNIQAMIHPSRVVRLIGSEIPELALAENGWGDSVLQATADAILAAGLTMQGVAALVHEAKLDIIKIPSMTEKVSTAQYRTRLLDRFALTSHAKSLMNVTLMDKDEDWDRKDINFANLPDIVKVYLLIASGAADIPATRMLGQSPVGMNATGESDLQNYYDRIRAEQTTELGPLLERLDEVLIRSALGERPPEVYYEWASLWQMSEVQRAEVAERKAKVFQADVTAGLIDPEALREARENQLIEDGTYPGLEAALEEAEARAEEDVEEEPEPAEALLTAVAGAREGGGAVGDALRRLAPGRLRKLISGLAKDDKADAFTHITSDGRFGGYAVRWEDKAEDGAQFLPGAFAEALARHGAEGIKLLYQHRVEEPIGRWLELAEDWIGLRVYGQLNMDLELAREVASNIGKGIISGLSIGTEGEQRSEGGLIAQADLVEISLVTWPMMAKSKIDGGTKT